MELASPIPRLAVSSSDGLRSSGIIRDLQGKISTQYSWLASQYQNFQAMFFRIEAV